MAQDNETESQNTGPSRFEGEAQHGWSPDVGTGGSERATEANKKAFGTPPAGSGPGRQESDEERSGVEPADTNAESALGVGTSTTSRAEDYGKEGDEGRVNVGTKGASDRPFGTTDPDKDAGVDPQAPIDPSSPYLPPA
jgi:hypothetical protein